jgi:replication factor C subunit 1
VTEPIPEEEEESRPRMAPTPGAKNLDIRRMLGLVSGGAKAAPEPAPAAPAKSQVKASVMPKGEASSLNKPPGKAQVSSKPPGKARAIKRSPSPKPKARPNKAPAASLVKGPLSNETFVITGILSGYDRESLTETLKSLGAKVTGNVSSRTTCLIYGEVLETGKPYTEGNKYKKAKELGTRLMDCQALTAVLEVIREKAERTQSPPQPKAFVRVAPREVRTGTQPWTEKYAPKNWGDILGHNSAVEKLRKWLFDWEEVVLQGKKKTVNPMKGGKFDPQMNVNARAAMLSGPPGIGKTTAARLVAADFGFRAVEMNASDVRSRKAIFEPLKATSDNLTLTGGGNLSKTLLIMDEVDGMSAGDRGGVAALIEVIKRSKVPVICICNDRQSQKLKSLMNSCFDIRFNKPQKSTIARRVSDILSMEGVSIEPNALDFVIESSANDIRQILITLETWSRTQDSFTYTDTKTSSSLSAKDSVLMMNNFDAAGKLLRAYDTSKLSHRQQMDLFFIDYDLIPLLIHQNYLEAMGNDLDKLAEAADSIAFGDVLNSQIRTQGNWSLLGQYGQAAALTPGRLSGGGVPFVKFTEYLGKASTLRKKERMLKEISVGLGLEREAVLNDYVPLITSLVLTPVLERGKEGIEATVDTLYEFRLKPEMLKEHLIELSFNSEQVSSLFKSIPSAVKSGITRLYGRKYAGDPEKTSKGKKKGGEVVETGEEEEEEQDIEDIDL